MISILKKTALITGGGRGIGRAIALQLARAGADIALCDIDEKSLLATAEEIKSIGRRCITLQADVSVADSVSSMVDSCISQMHSIDILINNAGITRDGMALRMKESDWDAVININLKSAFLCSKDVVRHMMKNKFGKIVNISSVIGIMGNAGQVNYAASKAGIIGITKSFAKEFASRNITVNAVAPGFIQSAMTDKLSDSDRQNYLSRIPLGRFGIAEDVANSVLFLVSPLASYITGQVIVVDGGLVM